MDYWEVVAIVLWASFLASLVGAVVGLVLTARGRRSSGLCLLLASTLVQLVFSFAAGFRSGASPWRSRCS